MLTEPCSYAYSVLEILIISGNTDSHFSGVTYSINKENNIFARIDELTAELLVTFEIKFRLKDDQPNEDQSSENPTSENQSSEDQSQEQELEK